MADRTDRLWLRPRIPERIACTCCQPRGERLDLQTPLCVGFGPVRVTRDGRGVYLHLCYDDAPPEDCLVEASRFEAVAASDPEHDWRIDFLSPLRRNVYQRQEIGGWYVIETGGGFA